MSERCKNLSYWNLPLFESYKVRISRTELAEKKRKREKKKRKNKKGLK